MTPYTLSNAAALRVFLDGHALSEAPQRPAQGSYLLAALNGNDRPEHIFGLPQSLALYDFNQSKMLECDRHLEATLAALGADTEHDTSQLPRPRTKKKQVNTPSFDVRAALFGVLGVDLNEIHGMGPSLSL